MPPSLPPQARREASLPKVKLIRALQDDAIRRRVERRHDPTSMAVAARLLEINPDVVTAWNLRRETIVSLAEQAAAAEAAESTETKTKTETKPSTPEGDASPESPHSPPHSPSLEDELALTEKTLRKNPKSYPSWHHRRWTVRRIVEAARCSPGTAADADAILAREMRLVEKLLEMDDRNFHCWGYRRFVVELAGASPSDELAFTTRKIEANFSNYSAWHHRSSVLPLARGVPGDGDGFPPGTRSLPKDVLDAEYELVQQAFFTEPEDQSGWMYHRWLTGQTAGGRTGTGTIGNGIPRDGDGEIPVPVPVPGDVAETLDREAALCRELIEMEPGSRWPVATLARLRAASGTGAGAEESRECFKKLEGLDPMRRGYYCDCGGWCR